MLLQIHNNNCNNTARYLLSTALLLICFVPAQSLTAQDMVLKTSAQTLSLSNISACKETDCFANSVKIITDALNNAKVRADETMEQRKYLLEKIAGYNDEVAAFYKVVDSLADLYVQNTKEMDAYRTEQSNFNDNNRFVPTGVSSGVAVSNGQPPTVSRSSQSASPGILTMNASRVQRDLDDKALKEKGKRLNTERQHIADGKGVLEKKRVKLLAEGNYLNNSLKKNTDSLQEANTRLSEVLNFSKQADKIFPAELQAKQRLAPDLVNRCELLVAELKTRVEEANAITINAVKPK